MMAISSTPKTRFVMSLFTRFRISGSITMAKVPQRAPQIVPRPPMITPVIKMIEKLMV